MLKKFLIVLMLIAATPALAGEACPSPATIEEAAKKDDLAYLRVTEAEYIKAAIDFLLLVRPDAEQVNPVIAIVFVQVAGGGGMIMFETKAGLCDFIQTKSDAVFAVTIQKLLGTGA